MIIIGKVDRHRIANVAARRSTEKFSFKTFLAFKGIVLQNGLFLIELLVP